MMSKNHSKVFLISPATPCIVLLDKINQKFNVEGWKKTRKYAECLKYVLEQVSEWDNLWK